METPARLLSGGNMQKLILARTLTAQPKFILANQPVRGLDEGAIAFVHEQLLNARGNWGRHIVDIRRSWMKYSQLPIALQLFITANSAQHLMCAKPIFSKLAP